MIEIIRVSKKFRIWEDRSRDLKETAVNFLRGKKRSFRDLWALQGIDLKIHEGETVAFIGENGSGKSTLLKLLAGIYVPDEGKIFTQGKISSLLELGVGFHPDLTGEENVYLNGAMLGFNRNEMEKRFDEILSFSELGDFIYSPIRTYSSGMAMRLGFSVAMCVDPDILLIDEVLAVGDEAFQSKCLERLEAFKSAKKTIIIVSHALGLIKKFCERVVLLHHGQLMMDGVPGKAISRYHALLAMKARGTEIDQTDIGPREEEFFPIDEGDLIPGRGKLIHSSARRLNEQVEKDREKVSEEEIELDLERIQIIEVQDTQFFAGGLFLEAFGQTAPRTPKNYVAIYRALKDPSTFHVIGYIHVEQTDEMDLIGGLCVDQGWQGKGLGKKLLRSVGGQREETKALFVYTDDSRLAMECGYEALSLPYLMVKWVRPLSLEEKERLIDAAMAIGPF